MGRDRHIVTLEKKAVGSFCALQSRLCLTALLYFSFCGQEVMWGEWAGGRQWASAHGNVLTELGAM